MAPAADGRLLTGSSGLLLLTNLNVSGSITLGGNTNLSNALVNQLQQENMNQSSSIQQLQQADISLVNITQGLLQDNQLLSTSFQQQQQNISSLLSLIQALEQQNISQWNVIQQQNSTIQSLNNTIILLNNTVQQQNTLQNIENMNQSLYIQQLQQANISLTNLTQGLLQNITSLLSLIQAQWNVTQQQNSTIQLLNNTIISLNNAVTSLNNTVTGLNNTVTSLLQQNSVLQQNLTFLNNFSQQLHQQLVDQNASLEAANNTISSLQYQINITMMNLSTCLSLTNSSLSQINSVNTTVLSLESQINVSAQAIAVLSNISSNAVILLGSSHKNQLVPTFCDTGCTGGVGPSLIFDVVQDSTTAASINCTTTTCELTGPGIFFMIFECDFICSGPSCTSGNPAVDFAFKVSAGYNWSPLAAGFAGQTGIGGSVEILGEAGRSHSTISALFNIPQMQTSTMEVVMYNGGPFPNDSGYDIETRIWSIKQIG